MIFIIGMPRSGTTLLERLLLAHPDVSSAGETPLIGTLYGQLAAQAGAGGIAAKLTPDVLRAMGAAYLKGIAERTEQSLRIIDKMPANHLFVPLIRLVFPRAAILHVHRHPLDTCLSCWEAGFSFGLDYAARFESLGAAYRQYAGVMEAWSALPGTRIFNVRYEQMVRETEHMMKGVLRACRLPWDPACVTPATDGQIKTASIAQARAPISDASIGRWRAHKTKLAPLIEALGGMDWIEAQAI